MTAEAVSSELPAARAVRAPHVVGVDLGGTKIAAGVVDRDGLVARRVEVATPLASQEELLEGLDDAVQQVVGDDVAAIGFGIPSTIDQRAGRAVFSTNIPLADLDFRRRMAERWGLPVAIDNDGNVAAIAEWGAGAAKGARTVIMLTLGTGIGGGLILDGRPFRGAVGAAAEIGHVVVEFDGPRCQGRCTGRGHLEALASGLVADAVARDLYGPEADAEQLVVAAGDGDRRAVDALATIGRRLGAGIASLVNVFDPDIVVIGGGFAEAGDFLLDPAREIIARDALSPGRDRVRIVRAALGNDAGMIGAGLIAFELLDRGAS